MGFFFSTSGKLVSMGTRFVTTKADCTGCRCCGNDSFGVGYTQCRFNRYAKIVGYTYRRYRNGTLWVTYTGTRSFPKVPAPQYAGGRGGNCCFCQEYLQTVYSLSTGAVLSRNIVAGSGLDEGFCYTQNGWWDGNEASAGPAYPPYVVSGTTPNGLRGATYFGCGVCSGLIKMRYFYQPPGPTFPVSDYADVQFYVHNPDCKVEGEPVGFDWEDEYPPGTPKT